MYTSQERKKIQNPSGAAHTTGGINSPKSAGMPNSAMASMLESSPAGYAIPDLESRMLSRMPSVQQRGQAQIPQAENEADRISAAVNVGTPEAVKAVMGQRMGADFSGVRFHTGAEAAAKADAMGARAYTSGADVYFGSEGFDPSVAAHELVHTAQQGMVDSGMPVMSAPVGGVQMKPKLNVKGFLKKFKKQDPMEKVSAMQDAMMLVRNAEEMGLDKNEMADMGADLTQNVDEGFIDAMLLQQVSQSRDLEKMYQDYIWSGMSADEANMRIAHSLPGKRFQAFADMRSLIGSGGIKEGMSQEEQMNAMDKGERLLDRLNDKSNTMLKTDRKMAGTMGRYLQMLFEPQGMEEKNSWVKANPEQFKALEQTGSQEVSAYLDHYVNPKKKRHWWNRRK